MSDGGGKLGLVLSGGGARGAFEVGVLSWIAEFRPGVLDRVKVVTGCSVGAVNAAFLASRGLAPSAVGELADIWRGLHLDRVLRLSSRRFLKVAATTARHVMRDAKAAPRGLFDTTPYEQLIRDSVDWPELERVVAQGRLDAFAVVATEIATGESHIFVDHSPQVGPPRWPSDRSLVGIPTVVGPEHVLASTSLPFIFSPARVGQFWYTDGGLRQNVPLSPALRLGAEHLLTVALKRRKKIVQATPGVFPGVMALAGKLLNGIFLDRMKWDLDRLNRINHVLESGMAVCGPNFVNQLQTELTHRGRRPYKVVRYVGIQPDEDLGAIAGALLRNGRLKSKLGWLMRRALLSEGGAQSDLASYLLFDGAFAEELIGLGRRAARACAADLDALVA